jgi:homoserine dehydrogenase
MNREIGVGLIGVGNVGGGVARALLERRDYFARQVGAELVVRRAAVRDPQKRRSVDLPAGVLTTNVEEMLADPAIGIVVEVMGGETPAGTYIRTALAAGKHVVTANKELIAKAGPELLADAHGRGLDIMFEASVGGGIPLIAPLRRDLLANRITSIRAIINGTTNYILTRMAEEGIGYREALAAAQELGYSSRASAFARACGPRMYTSKGSPASPPRTFRMRASWATRSSSWQSPSGKRRGSLRVLRRSSCRIRNLWPRWTACSTASRSSGT